MKVPRIPIPMLDPFDSRFLIPVNFFLPEILIILMNPGFLQVLNKSGRSLAEVLLNAFNSLEKPSLLRKNVLPPYSRQDSLKEARVLCRD